MERQPEHRNDKGFGDESFVLIRSHHWKSNVNRRPILLQAWIAEFADILLNEVILCQIPSIRRSNNTDPLVNSLVNKGACCQIFREYSNLFYRDLHLTNRFKQ